MMIAMVLISVAVALIGVGVAVYRVHQLPESISSMVYALERPWRWLWTVWLWAVAFYRNCGGLSMRIRRRMMQKGVVIHFLDPEAKRVLVGLWGGKDGGSAAANTRVGKRKVPGIEGELTYEQAASVISFNAVFKNNTALTSFNEMRFFTSLSTVSNCFTGCSSLRNIALPTQPIIFSNSAFDGCTSLTAVHITDWEAWFSNRYAYYTSMPTFYSHALYLNGQEVAGDVAIPDGIKGLQYCALVGLSAITSVHIPEGVTSIGGLAFYKCTGLTSVHIPEGVTSIGGQAFEGCTDLTSVHIPESVTTIGNRAFYQTGLTSVHIPESVTNIGNSAFYSCKSLVTAYIHGGTAIMQSTFSSCSSLEYVYISDNVVEIAAYAFYGTNSLKKVEIGSGVISFGVAPFSSARISTFVIRTIVPPSMTTLVGTTGSIAAIYVPDESVEAYKTAAGWSSYASKIHPLSEYNNE